jgi:hypothetical protein
MTFLQEKSFGSTTTESFARSFYTTRNIVVKKHSFSREDQNNFHLTRTMLRLSIAAIIAVLVNAATPDNVSSRLMIHVSAFGRAAPSQCRPPVGAAWCSIHFLHTFRCCFFRTRISSALRLSSNLLSCMQQAKSMMPNDAIPCGCSCL